MTDGAHETTHTAYPPTLSLPYIVHAVWLVIFYRIINYFLLYEQHRMSEIALLIVQEIGNTTEMILYATYFHMI